MVSLKKNSRISYRVLIASIWFFRLASRPRILFCAPTLSIPRVVFLFSNFTSSRLSSASSSAVSLLRHPWFVYHNCALAPFLPIPFFCSPSFSWPACSSPILYFHPRFPRVLLLLVSSYVFYILSSLYVIILLLPYLVAVFFSILSNAPFRFILLIYFHLSSTILAPSSSFVRFLRFVFTVFIFSVSFIFSYRQHFPLLRLPGVLSSFLSPRRSLLRAREIYLSQPSHVFVSRYGASFPNISFCNLLNLLSSFIFAQTCLPYGRILGFLRVLYSHTHGEDTG